MNIRFHAPVIRTFLVIAVFVFSFVSCQDNKDNNVGSFESLDPAFASVVDASASMEVIAEGFEWSEGPIWVEKSKMLLFSDVPRNIVHKWTAEKGLEKYLEPSGYTGSSRRGGETGSNGLTLDNNGNLILCQHGDRRVAKMDAPIDNPAPKFITIADNYQGKKFDSPNDVVVRKNGDFYFTDPPYGLEKNAADPLKESPYQGVYRVATDGKVSLLVDSISRPNGLAFTSDHNKLIVASSDSLKARWYIYDINANDSLVNGRVFYDATADARTEKGLPDGLKVDRNGNVFATGPGGIYIINSSGKLLGKIKIKSLAANCSFADDEKTLYVTADDYVLRIKLRK